jgi:hypothetical protein
VTLVGREHVAATKLIQRKLGLSGAISAPDVRSLVVVDSTRRTQAAEKRRNDKAVTPVAIEKRSFRQRSNRRPRPQGHRPPDRSR